MQKSLILGLILSVIAGNLFAGLSKARLFKSKLSENVNACDQLEKIDFIQNLPEELSLEILKQLILQCKDFNEATNQIYEISQVNKKHHRLIFDFQILKFAIDKLALKEGHLKRDSYLEFFELISLLKKNNQFNGNYLMNIYEDSKNRCTHFLNETFKSYWNIIKDISRFIVRHKTPIFFLSFVIFVCILEANYKKCFDKCLIKYQNMHQEQELLRRTFWLTKEELLGINKKNCAHICNPSAND